MLDPASILRCVVDDETLSVKWFRPNATPPGAVAGARELSVAAVERPLQTPTGMLNPGCDGAAHTQRVEGKTHVDCCGKVTGEVTESETEGKQQKERDESRRMEGSRVKVDGEEESGRQRDAERLRAREELDVARRELLEARILKELAEAEARDARRQADELANQKEELNRQLSESRLRWREEGSNGAKGRGAEQPSGRTRDLTRGSDLIALPSERSFDYLCSHEATTPTWSTLGSETRPVTWGGKRVGEHAILEKGVDSPRTIAGGSVVELSEEGSELGAKESSSKMLSGFSMGGPVHQDGADAVSRARRCRSPDIAVVEEEEGNGLQGIMQMGEGGRDAAGGAPGAAGLGTGVDTKFVATTPRIRSMVDIKHMMSTAAGGSGDRQTIGIYSV